MIRVVLIDDHALVRTGLRLIIEKQPDMEVVGEAEDGQAGLALIKQLQPDVALVDLHMPKVSGIEVTERAHKGKLKTRIAVLTVAGEAPFPRKLLAAGASGYLTKGCPAHELIKAIRQVADGRRYLSSDVAQRLALDHVSGNGNGASPFEDLSTRELEVAMLLAQGLSPTQIADRLKLSAKTVATYKYRLFEKLDIANVVTLAHLATVHGLMDANRPIR